MMTWKQRFARAKKMGYFSQSDYRAACGWGTCAVGEAGLRKLRGKKREDFLYDRRDNCHLVDLGHDFLTAVEGNKIDDAIEIHARVAKLARVKPN